MVLGTVRHWTALAANCQLLCADRVLSYVVGFHMRAQIFSYSLAVPATAQSRARIRKTSHRGYLLEQFEQAPLDIAQPDAVDVSTPAAPAAALEPDDEDSDEVLELTWSVVH